MRIEKAGLEACALKDRETFKHWGGSLSLEQYLERESKMRAHPWVAERMETWFLRNDRGDVLTSCEAIRMDSYSKKNGAEQPGETWGIASVFTGGRHRRRGFAGELILRIRDLKMREGNNVHALILFTYVGESVYARIGFQARPSAERIFEALPDKPERGVELITRAELADLWPRLERTHGSFVVWPSFSQLDRKLLRERIYADFLGEKAPEFVGARVDKSLIVWSMDYPGAILTGLFLRSETPVEADLLIASARKAAYEKGVNFSIWSDDDFQNWDELKAVSQDKVRDSIGMILPVDSCVQSQGWNFIPRSISV